jgi:hypothetical protein
MHGKSGIKFTNVRGKSDRLLERLRVTSGVATTKKSVPIKPTIVLQVRSALQDICDVGTNSQGYKET